MLSRTKCPFCKREFSDILKHFVLKHDIKDMDHLVEEIEKADEKEKVKVEFANYVDELKKEMREGIISAKEYRELIMKWLKEHSEV